MAVNLTSSATPIAKRLLNQQAVPASDLSSNASGKGASLIGVQDAAGIITATTVEGALAENRAAIDANTATSADNNTLIWLGV